MINPFQIGDSKTYNHKVELEDTATFKAGTVHPVYATFALARDAEWAGRLFVLEMKEETEEGIGTFIEIEHKSPALLQSEVTFTAKIESVIKNEIVCSFEAFVGERLIAQGKTGQKILKKEKLEGLFKTLENEK